MSDLDETKVEEVFQEAVDLPPAERPAFLDRTCGGDAALRSRVERLLRALDEDQTFLEQPAAVPPPALVDEPVPVRIGRYRVTGVLGVGGYGRVYAAEQEVPHRRVAIKTLRAGSMSPMARARFATEIELLGRLDHPGICQIFDAGEAEIEYPEERRDRALFFAMELVEGLPVTRFAAEHGLSPAERMALLAAIADAVHHAHQRGVIHRDLKPANVLVMPPAEDTGDSGGTDRHHLPGRPRVLDFGIARLTEQAERSAGMSTLPGTVLGTLGYMSPEQLAGSDDIDVRSDVWALGILGWELIAERLPFPVERRPLLEAARVVQEQEPDPLTWRGQRVDADLETVLRHALNKDPERRYSSAAELAADLRRYLQSEPIAARPPSLLYQARMFARRHRGLVAGSLLGVFALVAGAVVSVSFGVEAVRARDRAVDARDSAQEVTRFLREDLLEGADPARALGAELTVRELLDRAAERIDGRFPGRPLVEAAVRATLSKTYGGLGLVDEALAHARRAVELVESVEDAPAADRLDALSALGSALHEAGDPPEALEVRRRAWELAQQTLSPDDPALYRAAVALGDQLGMQGMHEEAEPLLRYVIAEGSRWLGPTDERVLTARNNLGLVLDNTGRYQEAIEEFRIVVDERRRTLTPDHPDTLVSSANLSLALWHAGKLEEARELCEDVLARRRRVLGDEHRQTLLSWNNLALIQATGGDLEAAVKTAREALEVSTRVLGAEHRDTLRLMANLAFFLLDLDRVQEALDLAVLALARAERAFPEGHWARSWHRLLYARCLHTAGRNREAMTEIAAAYQGLLDSLGPEHRQTRSAARMGRSIAEALGDEALLQTWSERVRETEPGR